jgi:L-histidine Nalpha-methyltransferase
MTDSSSGASTSHASAAGAFEAMRRDVVTGLSRIPRQVSPKYFYDERGSKLFERITQLPEYYPTRVERDLLERCAPVWIQRTRPALLVELGAGSASKSRILMDAMDAMDAQDAVDEAGSGRTFVPIDVSEDFLKETAQVLRLEYPGWTVVPAVADITSPVELPPGLPKPALFALLGGTIGNFEPEAVVRLFRRIAAVLAPSDRFLIGVDLRPGEKKPVELLESAYNDSEGVTAAFNLNVLRVLNARLGTDFDPAHFEHRAFWNDTGSRIEMHLVSRREQRVTIPDGADGTEILLRKGETIRTEISCKYDREGLGELLRRSGLELEEWCGDVQDRFALVLARTCA